MSTKHTTAATILAFDPATRRSSRRAAAITQNHEKQAAAAVAGGAAALRVPASALEADNGLYYFGGELRRIEAAYRQGRAAGRQALIAAIGASYSDGYQTGLEDGAMPLGAHGRR